MSLSPFFFEKGAVVVSLEGLVLWCVIGGCDFCCGSCWLWRLSDWCDNNPPVLTPRAIRLHPSYITSDTPVHTRETAESNLGLNTTPLCILTRCARPLLHISGVWGFHLLLPVVPLQPKKQSSSAPFRGRQSGSPGFHCCCSAPFRVRGGTCPYLLFTSSSLS